MEIWHFPAFRLYITAFYVPIDVRFDVSLAAYILWFYASLKNLSKVNLVERMIKPIGFCILYGNVWKQDTRRLYGEKAWNGRCVCDDNYYITKSLLESVCAEARSWFYLYSKTAEDFTFSAVFIYSVLWIMCNTAVAQKIHIKRFPEEMNYLPILYWELPFVSCFAIQSPSPFQPREPQ